MSDVMNVSQPNARPPFVIFEYRATEDRAKSSEAGYPVMVDVAWARVRQIGAKDEFEQPAETWLEQMSAESRFRPHMFPPEWVRHFRERFQQFKAGEAMQVNGTPIKGCTFLTPSEIINLTGIQVYSVEDAAGMNDEAMRRYGMGGLAVKNKCVTFLQTRDKEKATYELNQLKETCELQRMEIDDKDKRIAALDARLSALEAQLEPTEKGKRKAG